MAIPAKGEGGNFLTLSKFMKEIVESGVFYMLVAKQKKEVIKKSKMLEPPIEKFEDVMPLNLSSGPPPLKDIQHQINLILGSSLPNKAPCHMSPKGHEELKR